MCTVTETRMSCGHKFTSLKVECKQPSNCHTPTTKTSYLDDTCARCDREVHFHVIRTAYEEDHARLVRRYIQAKANNQSLEALQLQKEIAALHRVTRAKNATISTLRGDPDVLWP